MEEKMLKMKLHDELEIWNGLYIVRVPGGWLYRTDNEQVGGTWTCSTVFVPFNDEFKGKQYHPAYCK